VTPIKFNYNLMIKLPAPEKFSCFAAVEEEGAEEFLDKNNNRDKKSTEETGLGTTTAISSITSVRENSPFAAWRPFIPSNWQDNSSQNLPAQPYWQLFSAQPCFSQEHSTKTRPHSTKSWCTSQWGKM
jgi:hypothetical protein